MLSKTGTPNVHRSCYRPFVLGVVGFMGMAAIGHASVIMNLQPVSAAAGSTGNTFDVTLTNTGPGAITIGGFSFGLSVGTSDLSFTGVSTATTASPYVFDAESLFGPDISIQPPNLPGQELEAEDIFAGPLGGSVIGSGVTEGLGHVTFNLAPATPPGGIQINFIGADDSLSDPDGESIAFSTAGGAVTVTGSASVPEPATFGFLGMAFAVILVSRAGRKRRTYSPAGDPIP